MLRLIDAPGCLHSYKKITWRSAPVFGTCLTSLPPLDAFGQKNRRMLAGIVCEFPRFWKWKCEGIAKTKEDICHISTMSCYRETKGRTNFFTIFLKSHFFWRQISLSCEEGNDWLWTLLDWMVLVADIGSDLPACEPMWMSMESRFPILFGTKVAASMMSGYSDELSWTGAKITLWCYQIIIKQFLWFLVSTQKQNSMEEIGQNFHICLRSGPRWITPPPHPVYFWP